MFACIVYYAPRGKEKEVVLSRKRIEREREKSGAEFIRKESNIPLVCNKTRKRKRRRRAGQVSHTTSSSSSSSMMGCCSFSLPVNAGGTSSTRYQKVRSSRSHTHQWVVRKMASTISLSFLNWYSFLGKWNVEKARGLFGGKWDSEKSIVSRWWKAKRGHSDWAIAIACWKWAAAENRDRLD